MIRLIMAVCAGLFLLVGLGSAAHAADADKQDSLEASPSRQTISTKAGATKKTNLVVTNNSDKPMPVAFHVEQFSVDSASHAISFEPPKYDWVKASQNQIELQPGKNVRADFTAIIPSNAAEGEYYFALFASTKTASKTTRVASLIYLTVDGGGIQRSSEIIDSSLFPVVIGGSVPYSFDIQNTGNTHIEARSLARLEGILWSSVGRETHQIILPEQTRSVQGEVSSPFLPGIYTFTYGFSQESPQKTTNNSVFILYIPPWSIAAFVLTLLVISWLRQRRTG